MTSKTDEDIAEELIRASKIHLTLSYWAAVRKLILAALAAKSAARQEPCAVCGGDGKPVSGRQCICNGTGLLHVAELECRRLIYDLNLKIEKLESAARQDTERLDWLDAQKTEDHACWGGPIGASTVWVNPSASWEVEARVKDGTYKYPAQLKSMTVREAIDAARCGLDEGEQKKDLRVTEPATDVAHVRQNSREPAFYEVLLGAAYAIRCLLDKLDGRYIWSDCAPTRHLRDIDEALRWLTGKSSYPKGADSVVADGSSTGSGASSPDPVSVQERSESDSAGGVSS